MLLAANDIRRVYGDIGCNGQTVQSNRSVLALERVSLEVDNSDFFVVTGPSGAGKSTLLNILSGLDFPSEGEVLFQGESLTTMSERRIAGLRNSGFGFIFQMPHLLPDRTVRENVALPFHYAKWGGQQKVNDRCDELLDHVGLLDMAERYPNTLSGGEMQRVVIARAIARKPKVIFADEPTGSLDSVNSDKIVRLLQQQTDEGCAVVLVTHDRSMLQYSTKRLVLAKIGSSGLPERA